MDMRRSWASRNTLLVMYVRSIARNACKKKVSTLMMGYLAQEVTLADLFHFHLPYGTVIFEQLGLVNLEKRPNVQRWAILYVSTVSTRATLVWDLAYPLVYCYSAPYNCIITPRFPEVMIILQEGAERFEDWGLTVLEDG